MVREGPVRVRFAAGVAELPGDAVAVRLPEDAILRWRAMAEPPPGPRGELAAFAPGEPVVVGLGVAWEQGVVIGRVVRPTPEGRWTVDGDLRDYASPEEAAHEHGPLERGEALPRPAPPDEIPLGDPVTLEELAAVLGCAVEEVEAQVAALPRSSYLRFVARALAARPDMAVAGRGGAR